MLELAAFSIIERKGKFAFPFKATMQAMLDTELSSSSPSITPYMSILSASSLLFIANNTSPANLYAADKSGCASMIFVQT